jgi:hypothetical protein
LARPERTRGLPSSTMKRLGLVDTRPIGFCISTATGSGPWPGPLAY